MPEPTSPKSARTAKPKKPKLPAAARTATLLDLVAAIPAGTLHFMLGDSVADTDVEKHRAMFLAFCKLHPDFTDWRKAWESWQHTVRADAARTGGKGDGTTIAFNPAIKLLLTRLFPKNLRRVIESRGDRAEFEAAIKGMGEFARKYESEGYMPLCIEVLPPAMCPAGCPAVAVSHHFIQEWDVMQDPEIVFAVVEPDAWLPYEITQHPVGIYRCAYQDGKLYPAIVKDMSSLVTIWARNLSQQFVVTKPLCEVGSALNSALKGKVVSFPDPVRDCLAALENITL